MFMRAATNKRCCHLGWFKTIPEITFMFAQKKKQVKGNIFFNAVKMQSPKSFRVQNHYYYLPAMNSDGTFLTKLLFRFVHLLTML